MSTLAGQIRGSGQIRILLQNPLFVPNVTGRQCRQALVGSFLTYKIALMVPSVLTHFKVAYSLRNAGHIAIASGTTCTL
jgi:hypothetical protein